MPIYARICKKRTCGHTWDHLLLSFATADDEEKKGIPCPKCGCKRTKRSEDPKDSMENASRGFRRYGLWTYE